MDVEVRSTTPVEASPAELLINGTTYPVLLDSRVTLLATLRVRLEFAGTKKAAIAASAELAPCTSTAVVSLLSDGVQLALDREPRDMPTTCATQQPPVSGTWDSET